MAVVRVKPTQADVAIADAVAERTGRPTEHVAEAVTWGADEHVLCALALGWCFMREPAMRSYVAGAITSCQPNSFSEGPRESPQRGFTPFADVEQGVKRRLRAESFADHYSQARSSSLARRWGSRLTSPLR
jgi:hypothetical protein